MLAVLQNVIQVKNLLIPAHTVLVFCYLLSVYIIITSLRTMFLLLLREVWLCCREFSEVSALGMASLNRAKWGECSEWDEQGRELWVMSKVAIASWRWTRGGWEELTMSWWWLREARSLNLRWARPAHTKWDELMLHLQWVWGVCGEHCKWVEFMVSEVSSQLERLAMWILSKCSKHYKLEINSELTVRQIIVKNLIAGS